MHLIPRMRQLFIFTSLLLFLPLISNGAFLEDNVANSDMLVVSESADGIDVRFKLANLEHREMNVDGIQFDIFELENETYAGREGWPELPSVSRMVLIPPESGVGVIINDLKTHVIQNVNPIAKRLLREDEIEQGAYHIQAQEDLSLCKTSRESEDLYPANPVTLGEPVVLRGNRMIPVVVHPVRYNASNGELIVTDEIDFSLNFDSNDNRENLVRNSNRARPSIVVDRILNDLVINPPAPPRDNGIRNGSIVYVMGNWDNVEETLEPLIEWRRRMGWTVEVLRVANQNNAGAVKEAIQEAYDEWDTPPENVVLCGDTDGQFPMAYWDMRRGAAYPYESDHLFVTLDGDDIIPDAAVGRLIFNSIAMLEGEVEKIVSYESDPFIADNDRCRNWQRKAAVVAGDSRSGNSSIDVCRWTKNLVLRNGYIDVDELYWTPQNPQPNAANFIRTNFENGISLYLYRGWTFMSGFGHAEVDNLRNGRMLPFVMLATCNTGDYGEHVSSPFYYTERFLYSTRGGGIGAVGAAGATHTAYNNLIASETFRSIYQCGIPWQGWALMKSKIDLYRHYAPFDDIEHEENNGLDGWECETYIFNLMGDPATDLFTDVPHILEVTHPNSIRTGETQFAVEVWDDEVGELVVGTPVCLYKPGEMQVTVLTDDDGMAVFNLNPDFTQDGTIQLTVTGHNLMPYLVEFEVEDAQLFLGASDYDVEDGEGNGDGDLNPGETVELNINISNLGQAVPEGAVDVILSSDQPHINILDDTFHLEQAPAVGESMIATFSFEISGGFPAEYDAVFNVNIANNDNAWTSSVVIPVEGPVMVLDEFSWVGDPLAPADVAMCRMYIRNIGEVQSEELTAELISLTPTISIPDADTHFNAVSPDSRQLSQSVMQISANLFHIAGSGAQVALIVSSENGYVDTVFVSFAVSEAADGEPFGPDEYGYICVDDSDVNWYNEPEYNWIEIDPHRRGPGDDTELSDIGEEYDESGLFDLPFTFTYYGEEFDEITICTNGWLAMGDCHELYTARNRIMPSGMNAPGMICPFWDDLITTDNGGIYTYYDEDADIFIVEWSQMRKLGPRGVNEPIETFQVLLYNPETYPTITGDGDIVFQYDEVTDSRSCFQAWDTPNASVGICSPDQKMGLTYIYWANLTPGAAPLENERAIKFTTSVLTATGRVFGVVSDFATGAPVPDATVYTQHGFVAVTDENGEYSIENAAAEIEFDITARKQGFNDSTLIGFELEADEELEVNFQLLHPEFLPSMNGINQRVLVDGEAEVNFNVVNSGNGPLNWTAETRNPGNANAEPWELRRSIQASEVLNDIRIYGTVFTDGMYYIAGSGVDQPMIYVLNDEEEVIDSYEQLGGSHYGMTDLAWDGELLWGSGEATIFGFSTAGEFVTGFDAPNNPAVGIAWDSDREVIWSCGTTTNLVAQTRDGEEVAELNRKGLRIYGLAYYPEDPDGYNIYIFNRPGEGFYVHKMHPETGDTLLVASLTPEDGGRPKGAYITNEFDYYSWVCMCNADNASFDRIDIYQLDVRHDWIQIAPTTGILNPEEQEDFVLTLNPSGMPEVEIEGEIRFTHNAGEGITTIPVVMNVVGDMVRDIDVNLQQGWNMISINVIPPLEMYDNPDALGPDIELMTEQLRIDEEHHHIVVMKDGAGAFYTPSFNFCNIPYWDLTQGYQIMVDENVVARWSGEPIAFDADLPLQGGWNLIAYFPDYELSASDPDFAVLSPILEHVSIAKDGNGRFMLPGFDFSNMEPWKQGQGYQINVDSDLVLNYPALPDEGELAVAEMESHNLPESLPSTGANMSLLITNLAKAQVPDGVDIVAENTKGNIIGKGRSDKGVCGLAIWGDNPATDQVDGMVEGEAFRLFWIDPNNSAKINLSPQRFYRGSDLTYTTDELTVLSVVNQATIPEDYYLGEAYPNPFNGKVRLSFGLPDDGEVSIAVFDLTGRMVDKVISGEYLAGSHSIVWSADDLPSGLYLVQMQAKGFNATRKVMLMK